MTSDLFLSRVTLSQFRNFKSLDIDLPPRPGVLIVHGSNGLGKSSLFDALEWTLTGQIDHFRNAKNAKKVGNYLCRWRQGSPGSTSSALTFSDGSVVERSLKSAKATKSDIGGSVDDVASFLRSPDWQTSISSLDRYLLLTHFLGQSVTSRMTHRAADERFEMLKEAAQSDRIEAVADAMHGKGNTTAARAFLRRIDTLSAEAKAMRDLLDQEAQLWEGGQAAGALDEDQALTLAREIGRLIPNDPTTASASASREGLDELQSRLDQAAGAAGMTANRLQRARQVVDEAIRHRSAAAVASAARDVAARDLDEADAALNKERQSRAARDEELVHAARDLAAAKNRLERMVDLHGLAKSLADVETEVDLARRNLAMRERSAVLTSNAHERSERRSRIVEWLEKDVGETDRLLASEFDRERLVTRWLEADDALADATEASTEGARSNPNIGNELAEAEREEAEAREAEAAQATSTSELEASVGDLTAAVAEIAVALPDDACECPVCATTFAAGELKSRAAAAAERLAPMLTRQRMALVESQNARAAAEARADRLRSIAEWLRHLERRATDAVGERSKVSILLGLDAGARRLEIDGIRSMVAERARALQVKRERRRRWLDRLSASPDGLVSDTARTRRARDEAASSRDAAFEQLESVEAARRRTAERVNALAAEFPEIDWTDAANISDATGAATDAHERAVVQHATVLARQQEARSAAASLEAANASAQARLDSALETANRAGTALAASIEEWSRLDLESAEPDHAAIDAASARLTRLTGDLDRAEFILRRLRSGREASARQQSHRSSLERLRAALDAAPYLGREQLRAAGEQFAADRRREADETTRTKEIAREASTTVYDELADFNAEYIEPLDRLTKQINLAILTDPDAGIDLHVRDRRIEQSASRTANVPKEVGEVDPALVHSEGQLAALAVGMLCAASLTYPWSRWRAMILDDPLQHNDAIHSAAFADLMGNLVLDRGYQILLSTHELAQAEFLQRKFESRRMPCARLHLLGQGRDGVDTEFRPARSEMPLAASA